MYSWEYVMGVELEPIVRVRESNFKRERLSDYIPEPKGWHNCPCEVPKCPRYEKCGKSNTQCKAFEEWAENGEYRTHKGDGLIPFDGHTYPRKNTDCRTYTKGQKILDKSWVKKLESLWLDMVTVEEIARQLGITEGYVNTVVRLHRKDKSFNFIDRRMSCKNLMTVNS